MIPVMKKTLCAALAALLMISVLGVPGLALHAGVRAAANQELHFRTGPNTAYTDLYVLPESTPIVAIEFEEGNDVTWVLCDFEYRGSRVRGYTGLRRMSLESADIDYAHHTRLQRSLVYDADVFSSPDLTSSVRTRLSAGTTVTFLEFEGAYCFIEYKRGSQLERGYVREECFMIDQDEFLESFPENDADSIYVVSPSARMYAAPGGGELLYDIPYDSSVSIYYDEYLFDGYMSVYYGGLHGYVSYLDLNDLRGLPQTEY